MQAAKLPLRTWFLDFYLIGLAITGIFSLVLNRHLDVKCDTTLLLHNKIMRAMTEREEDYLLRGKIQMDDVYLGGKRPGRKAGRGSEIKIPILPEDSLNDADLPIHARITFVSGFNLVKINDWAKRHLARGSHGLSDGLACFCAVITANCHHKSAVTACKHPNVLLQYRWINTLLGNLKSSVSITFLALNFAKYVMRYLGGYCFRFNRHFSVAGMIERIANADCCCISLTERDRRVADAYWLSSMNLYILGLPS